MRVIEAENVREAWHLGMKLLLRLGELETSRTGKVRVMSVPVTTIYENPCQRVLLDPYRDANPFFHVMEFLWMIDGRRDAALLNRYVNDFGERFAETDG